MFRRTTIAASLVLAMLWVATPAGSSVQDYRVTLPSGKSYVLKRIDDTTISVADGGGQNIGTLKATGGRGQVQVFDKDGKLLGKVGVVNPDGVKMLADNSGTSR